jgi:signal transduction histidine kinase
VNEAAAMHLEAEQRYRAIVDRCGFGVWEIADDGTTLFVNPPMCRMLEVDGVAELKGRDPSAFLSNGLARMVAAQADAGGCAEVEIVGLRGGRRHTIGFASPPEPSGNAPTRSTIFAFADVTALRRVQERSLQAQKLEAVGRLAGGVAHDFNNLLTIIYACCGILGRRLADDDPGRPQVAQIEAAVKRGSDLTRQVLSFARQDAVQPTAVDVNEVVKKMIGMLRHVIGDDIELRANADRSLRPVRADRGQLEQVLMNLALNARDAMPRGGKLVISTANVELDAREAVELDVDPGRYVLLAVADTGHGMDEETRARVFEPFFTTKEGKGSGLGLATAFGIARQSGGAITVDSAPGRGATFRVWLPVATSERPAPASLSPPRMTLRGTQTVLLVDDEEMIRSSLAEFLRMHGFTVLEARSGADALEQSKRYAGEIDLLVTDVVMPRMGGKTLAETLAALRPSIKVLYLTGHSESTIIRRGHIDAGVALLQKPFPPEALVSRILELVTPEAAG